VYAHDVGMPEGGSDVCLPVEPLAVLRVGGHCCRQYLQRVLAGEPRMLDEVHLTHATGTQELDDRIARECLPSGQ
jgi:hypothetical protein